MITGAILGIIIAFLVMVIIYLTGISRAHHSQVAKLNEELLASRTMLGRFVSLEQERLKIKESINVNFTEENITLLASRISMRVQTIINAAQDAALGKLS